ncbi:MAG: metal ABC transporter substrate-binding protein [Nocardioidaceae bacterium]
MRKPVALLGAVTVAALLAGCDGASSASDDGPVVVAAFYPFAYVAERVAGDTGTVANLTAPGVEPHDLELSPQQVASLSEADLVVYEKTFQPAVDDAVEQNVDGATVEVTEVAPLEDTTATDGDPHVWLDPTKLVPVAEAVADELAKADPDNADSYRSQAEELVADLEALDQEFASTLAGCERQAFVTSHEAFGYLALRYDLEMISIAGISPDAEPSPARLAELRDVVQHEGITTVFTETLVDPAIAETLAAEADVETGVLDPVEGLTDETKDEDYLSLMRSNLTVLAKANDCG